MASRHTQKSWIARDYINPVFGDYRRPRRGVRAADKAHPVYRVAQERKPRLMAKTTGLVKYPKHWG